MCILSLLFAVPVFAGDFEDAMKNSNRVCLYVYTPSCGYCKKFEPNYKKLVATYGQKCKFVKVNGETEYGARIGYKYGVKYVPYVALIYPKTQKGTKVSPDCLLDYACISNKINAFIK